MKVLITGGTGFIGREIVNQLLAAGHSPRLLVRDPAAPRARALSAKGDVELIAGDVLDAEALRSTGKDCDAVIHLVGIISEAGSQTFERVHTEATRNMVAAAQTAGLKRFIHMSALGTRANAASRYHRTKWAAEECVRASGLEWTIFRPSIVYGPGDGFVNLFARMSRWSPVLPLIGGGQTRFQPIPVADVARAFVGALTEPASRNQTLDLCGSETLRLTEIVQAVLKVSGRRRLCLPLPFGVATLQAGLAEFIFGRLLRQPPPLNRDQVMMLREDNVGNGAEARRLFGLSAATFREGVQRYVN
jgi:NADH dehydrogenase